VVELKKQSSSGTSLRQEILQTLGVAAVLQRARVTTPPYHPRTFWEAPGPARFVFLIGYIGRTAEAGRGSDRNLKRANSCAVVRAAHGKSVARSPGNLG
jgi:hypothetical protein